MGRPIRFIPENTDGVLVEVTVRTIGARALLTPSPNPTLFNQVVVGVLGRALEVSPIELCGAVWLGTHYHLLCVVHEQQELSRLMQHLGGNLSKEIGGRMRRWRGSFWERRFDQVVVSDEAEAQWRQLKYLVSHGVKEGLVDSPLAWPGVHCAGALVHGEKLEGYWWNRSKEWAALRRGQDVGTYDFATRYQVGFAPLPAFRHLSAEEYQDKMAALVREIEEEGHEARGAGTVAGVEKILGQNPYEVPTGKTKRSMRPSVHAQTREAKKAYAEEYRAFLGQYGFASGELRGPRGRSAAGDFPYGCYPPALPFTGAPAPLRPPAPATRRLIVVKSKVVERGPVPTVEIPVRILWGLPPGRNGGEAVEPQARGQPP